MNIMFLIYSFNTGGIERLLIDMSSCMIERGSTVYLCVINNDYTQTLLDQLPSKTHIIKLDREPGHGRSLHYAAQLSAIIGQYHIQVLHCQGVNCVIFSAIVKLFHRHLAIINTVHTCGNFDSYSNLKIFVQNRICSMTVAISHTIEQEILSRHVPQSKVTTIYNAINTDKFQYSNINSSTFPADISKQSLNK